jgi:hypothetical protein
MCLFPPAALSSHPLVAFMARQLLSDCVAAAGSSELATQQLSLLHKLLGASAAVAAVPGASCSGDSRQSAEAVVDTMAAVLQVCVATVATAMWTAIYTARSCDVCCRGIPVLLCMSQQSVQRWQLTCKWGN